MRRAVVLLRNERASPCLWAVGVPVFGFLVTFLFPTACSQSGSRRRSGDLMVQLCDLLQARYQNRRQLRSRDLAAAGGLGLLALMRSLTFSCHFSCSCLDYRDLLWRWPA